MLPITTGKLEEENRNILSAASGIILFSPFDKTKNDFKHGGKL